MVTGVTVQRIVVYHTWELKPGYSMARLVTALHGRSGVRDATVGRVGDGCCWEPKKINFHRHSKEGKEVQQVASQNIGTGPTTIVTTVREMSVVVALGQVLVHGLHWSRMSSVHSGMSTAYRAYGRSWRNNIVLTEA